MKVEQRKAGRLNVRLPESQIVVLRAGAAMLDCSVSELVRRASLDAALTVLGKKQNRDDG